MTSLSLSCIGEGNSNPLQCSCLENPRDRGAWWAAVYGVALSRTRLKGLSIAAQKTHYGDDLVRREQGAQLAHSSFNAKFYHQYIWQYNL